jgi:predicted enzyme related to lactoylglutathione lyase
MDPVVHFEFPFDNRERIVKFYQAAFGWQMQMLGEEMGNYVVVTTAEHDIQAEGTFQGAIGGGFFERKADWPDQVPSVVIAVQEIQAAMHRVTQAGGAVLGEPMLIPGIGSYVSFRDTEGNRVSMLQPLPRL